LRQFVVGVTGASGSLCARSLLRALAEHPQVGEIHVVLSHYAIRTINAEIGGRARDEAGALRLLLGNETGRRGGAGGAKRGAARTTGAAAITLHRADAMEAPISSGSFPTDGMVVVPCSGGTLAAIANGTSANLVQRAAEVTLKERRPLVLALRETPLSLVHVENMRRAARAGAILYPLMPAFYTGARTVDEIVEQFTARILDLLHLPHGLGRRWGGAR
jgi:flavin prenyltransferase